MVTGLTANILAAGLTSYLLRVLSGGGRPIAIHLTPLPPWPIPGLAEIPVVGPLLFALPPLTYLAIVGCVALERSFSRTQAGLTLRATGENPEAVFASAPSRFACESLAVVACGAVAGLGGAVLSLQQVGTFTDGMTGGRGYLALASLIVARWNPVRRGDRLSRFRRGGSVRVAHCRASAFRSARISCRWRPMSIALAVLAGLGRSSRMPASIGQPLQWD